MKLILKSNVRLDGLVPQMTIALLSIMGHWESLGATELVITAANDSKHGPRSLHSRDGMCRALDIRTKQLYPVLVGRTLAQRADILKSLGETIASGLPCFDVIMESINTDNEHLHIEWDPKPELNPITRA